MADYEKSYIRKGNALKRIEKWLKENGIEYSVNRYGNPYYFNDGFSVTGIQITFFWDGVGNDWDKRHSLERFMSRKKSYSLQRQHFGGGVSYIIMTAFDAARWHKHEKAIADAVEAFWQAEHARRMKAVV